jgi:hypothetical protein
MCQNYVDTGAGSDSLRAGRSGNRIPVGGGEIFRTFPPGAHPASYTVGTGSFLGVKRPGRDADTTHLASRLKNE